MDSLLLSSSSLALVSSSSRALVSSSSRLSRPSLFLLRRAAVSPPSSLFPRRPKSADLVRVRRLPAVARSGALMANSTGKNSGVYTVGDFMTKKEDLHVVKTTTTVDKALQMLVEYRVTGFPVIDDDWKLVGVVSDYDLLALDSISGTGLTDTSMFPAVDSSWKAFNEIQKLLSKTNGSIIEDVMTPAPLVVHETTNLEDAARLLLETKYRRFPVVDGAGKLVGIITRGNVVRAALKIKRSNDKSYHP